MHEPSTPLRPPRRAATAACVALAAALHLVATQWAVLATGLRGFRATTPVDQLGYLSIATDVMNGTWARVEPYTQTGTNTYPRLYYSLVGIVARLAGHDPVVGWNLTACVFQGLMVGALGLLCVRLSGRAWTALLAPLPFLVGTFSWVLARGGWRTTITAAGAVVNGMFASLSVLNGETAGLATGIAALCLAGRAWLLPTPRHRRTVLTAVACGMVGLVANMQTYSFIVSVWLLGALAAAGMLVRAARWWSLVTASLVMALYVTGPTVSAHAGQLPTLVYGLLPTLPGLWLLARRERGRVVLWAGALAVCAAPQLLTTLYDLHAGDPFLLYRTTSNHDLGVLHLPVLLAAVPVSVPLVACHVLGRRARVPAVTAISGAAMAVAVVASTNDVWGANAEPYRLWIETAGLGACCVLVCLLLLARHGALPSARVLGLLMVPAVLSLPDLGAWWAGGATQQVWHPGTSRGQAVRAVASRVTDDRLLLVDQCTNPQTTQVLTGLPIAYYRLGMAWPARRSEIDAVLGHSAAGELDAPTLAGARVGWVLTDTGCASRWDGALRAIGARPVASVGYTGDPSVWLGSADRGTDRRSVVLWRLTGPGA